ncbi:hypothetical protein Nmel_012158 [Mimus melanotis]
MRIACRCLPFAVVRWQGCLRSQAETRCWSVVLIDDLTGVFIGDLPGAITWLPAGNLAGDIARVLTEDPSQRSCQSLCRSPKPGTMPPPAPSLQPPTTVAT